MILEDLVYNNSIFVIIVVLLVVVLEALQDVITRLQKYLCAFDECRFVNLLTFELLDFDTRRLVFLVWEDRLELVQRLVINRNDTALRILNDLR